MLTTTRAGADATAGEAGEALTVVDREEAWVFTCWPTTRVLPQCGPPESPDAHVAVVANQFVITTLPPEEQGSQWLASANVKDVATRSGLWDGSGQLNFLEVYGLSHPHLSTYSTRRVWRVFDVAAPSKRLPAETDEWARDYPFSVPVEGTLGAEKVMALLRDHYEGTPYDMTRGLAAGRTATPPWDMAATPDVGYAAADSITLEEATSGKFERAISMFRTSYSFVSQSRGKSSELPSISMGGPVRAPLGVVHPALRRVGRRTGSLEYW